MAAQSVAKVWLLRHQIQGVPLPADFLATHPEARVPVSSDARLKPKATATASASASPTKSPTKSPTASPTKRPSASADSHRPAAHRRR